MNLFFFTVIGFYFLGILLVITGWKRSLARKSSIRQEALFFKKITVVVPFRNEEACIDDVIQDIFEQRYPSDYVEVILVDDHSTDRSSEIVSARISGRTHFRWVSLPVGREGKKQAITYAVQQAEGEIIVTTDADCRLPVHWLQSIHSSFYDVNVKMVFGGVRMKEDKSFFSRIQALEFCSLIGTGAAMAGWGLPMLCNGANLAFLKSAFMEVDGYRGNLDIPSGDDEFLMHKIHRRFPGSIYFQPAGDSVVETRPLASLKEFVDQRLRWAGKWKHSGSRVSQFTAVFILVFQTSFLVLWFAPLLNWISGLLTFLLIAGKMIFEFIFLYQVSTFLHTRLRPFHFLLLQFLYPLYVIVIGLASPFTSPRWKGRKG